MKKINYSIIIPHKNIPNLLQRCLDSIPRREDIQIIVVDDNSDTDKVDFHHFPGLGEPCVEVYFAKEGKGAGYARNVGLKYAKGKWLLFADADDFYADNAFEVLDRYVSSELDIVYFGVYDDKNGVVDRLTYIKNIYQKYFEGKLPLDAVKYLIWTPWNKLISKSLVDRYNISFEEIPVGNDAMFSLIASEKAADVSVEEQQLYCITYNPNSISFSTTNYQKEIAYLDINFRINKFLRNHGLWKFQLRLLKPRSIIAFSKNYGLKNTFNFVRIIAINDTVLRYIALYLYDKFAGNLKA